MFTLSLQFPYLERRSCDHREESACVNRQEVPIVGDLGVKPVLLEAMHAGGGQPSVVV